MFEETRFAYNLRLISKLLRGSSYLYLSHKHLATINNKATGKTEALRIGNIKVQELSEIQQNNQGLVRIQKSKDERKKINQCFAKLLSPNLGLRSKAEHL